VGHWTAGTDFGSDGSYFWCSDKTVLRPKSLNWKKGQPNATNGECLFYQFSPVNANVSTFAHGNCAEERNFICEVKFNIIR